MKLNKRTQGILWIIFHCFSTALTAVFIKILSKDEINVFVILVLQNFFALILINFWAKAEGINDLYKTKNLKLHFFRALVGIVASAIVYYSFSIMPITKVTAISFSEPLFSVVLAVLILKEKIYLHRTAALFVGFIGTIIVIRPDSSFDTNSLLVLLSAFIFGFVNIFIKKLGNTEKTRTILVYRYLFFVLFTLPPAIYYWKTPTLYEFGLIGMLALSLSMSATSVVKALSYADVTVVSPFRFSKLIFVGILGYFIFKEVVDMWTIVGSIIIIVSVVYISYRESSVYKKTKKESSIITKGTARLLVLLIPATLALTACGEKEIPLKGERISILDQEQKLTVDTKLRKINVNIPRALTSNNTKQNIENIKYAGKFGKYQKIEIGSGEEWETELIPNPVAVGDILYVIDSVGVVSAHSIYNVKKVLWIKNTTPEGNEHEAIGGGIEYSDGKLIISTGYGDLIALNIENGDEIWRTKTMLPLRSAPVISGKSIFVVNMQNEVLSFDINNGEELWGYSGIREITGVIGSSAPIVDGKLLIIPFTSGELSVLNKKTSREIWSEFISSKKYSSISKAFSDIDAKPLVKRNRIFVASNAGVIKAFNKQNGKPLWTQEILVNSDIHSAGDFLFFITGDSELVCAYDKTCGIKWKTQLPIYENAEEKEDLIHWTTPVIVNGEIFVIGSHGIMINASAYDGGIIKKYAVPKDIYNKQIFIGNNMFLVNKDGYLFKTMD